MKKRLSVWFSAAVLVVALFVTTVNARKPKPQVQLYGDSYESIGENVYDENHKVVDVKAPFMFSYSAFLILPDGSHASALCMAHVGTTTMSAPCTISPFAAEKRVTVPCDLLKELQAKEAKCYKSEWYEFERKNNDITLSTAQGKVTYHITGSW
jgi:hypothetical protein